MMKLETPIGEFTTDSYKIPAEDTLAVSPDQKTIYPLTIEQHDSDQITLSDHYHSIILELNNLPNLQVKPWYPVIKKKNCIPCTNCGRCSW